ncbi:hypothetical protein M5F03_14835 [Acinetobacter sp. ANC 5579]|uniref:Z1 domain-containing protein n=1 Tax=Acinetobacter amyesii TaxID=2942470 RepID=UPI0020BDAA83|nr:Z1 domain-containing protein [Acinetobacter amyesii]MCL6236407.1 hypothetical protein [Acinetobacter amyesii]
MQLNGPFYTQFKERNTDFSRDTFTCAEETIKELLNTKTSSEHPGMLLGKVQSGKTRTFISTLVLGFDNEYDIAIVLSKNSKALIQQTYKRLSKDFEGFIDEKELEIHDIMQAPTSFSKFELQSKLIFVAKKQDDNLRRLIDQFQNNPMMITKRVLIIDDEADSASIGYTKKDDLINANKIATQISSLRSIIKDVSFLQVTATPYSLYLQPQEIETDNVIDFKPMRPAFTKLVPVPKEYVGGDTYFGEQSKIENTIENLIHKQIDIKEFNCLKKQDNRVFKLDDVLTTKKIQGYRNALVSFIVAGCIQRINGAKNNENHKKLLYSFLVHSESGKPAHNWQETLTNAIIDKLRLAAESKNGDSAFITLIKDSYDDFLSSLQLDEKPIPTFQEVLDEVSKALSEEYITVTKVNSEENVINMLDDSGQLKLRSPLHIFIGGQVLDRGITLTNLIGFYYGRRPNKFQQDTVLQHSRMFGYRRELLAVTRFYTSINIRNAMELMEEFDSALRTAISNGADGAVQFIRQAKDGKVIPCSPNKILISQTETIRPHKRILPKGFLPKGKTGKNNILPIIHKLDQDLEALIAFNSSSPKIIDLETALKFLKDIENTLKFDEDSEIPLFNWNMAYSALIHLSHQNQNASQRGKILLWTAKDRNLKKPTTNSNAHIADSPDSKTEVKLAQKYAIDMPIMYLIRQNGKKEDGWNDTPFYWPVIRAQANAKTSIFALETIE